MSFPVSKSKMVQLRKSRSNGKFKAIRPQLTSVIDMMTVLLCYLLQSFSSEGEIVTVSKNLDLPQSTAQKTPQLTTVVTVNNDVILAEGQALARVDEVLATDDLVIPQLNDWLQVRRQTTEKLAKYSTSLKFKGDVMIVGDKRIRFRLLKKIMYTCGQQGFNNFSLAVLKKEK
ncbi:MAG: biopolymer transporter ExbD [Chitinivibrionales bacterium]|nr:biopolymer transporter ExbD [Chitinivibrionales bacterium]